MRSFRIPALLALVLVVGLIAGCGGGSDSTSASTTAATGATGDTGSTDTTTSSDSGDYAGQVDAALASFNKNYASLGKDAANPSSAGDYLQTVKSLKGEVDDVVSNLNDIQPPAEAADFQDSLTSAFEDLGKGLDPIIQATENKDQQALLDAAGKFATASTNFAQESIKLGTEAEKAGFSIPSLTGGG
jgi:hypothetical protein